MPKQIEIKKVLVIGSGPIVIGQAAEFDYAGTPMTTYELMQVTEHNYLSI